MPIPLRASTLVVGLSWMLNGCIFVAAGAVGGAIVSGQGDFENNRAQLKRDAEKGLMSKEAAEAACVGLLADVDRGHLAPQPYPSEICRFDSFADKKYELTRLAERGQLSTDELRRRCLQLTGKPDGEEACRFDPFGDRAREWKRLVDTKQSPKELVEHDCNKFVNEAPRAIIPLPKDTAQLCQF